MGKSMERVFIIGLMEVSIKMIWKRDMESMNGKMVESIWDGGKKENSMV
jgi:hypothetical protein